MLSAVGIKSQSAAACLAIVSHFDKNHAALKKDFVQMANSAEPASQVTGALCLGELGKLSDLSGETSIFEMIKRAFQSPNEEVRHAASICLGNVTIGNPVFFLKKVFALVSDSEAKQKYLFLNTIREIVISDSNCLQDYLP